MVSEPLEYLPKLEKQAQAVNAVKNRLDEATNMRDETMKWRHSTDHDLASLEMRLKVIKAPHPGKGNHEVKIIVVLMSQANT